MNCTSADRSISSLPVTGRLFQPPRRAPPAPAIAKPAAGGRPATAVGESGELEDVGGRAGERDHPATVSADQERDVLLHRPDTELVDVRRARTRRRHRPHRVEQRPEDRRATRRTGSRAAPGGRIGDPIASCSSGAYPVPIPSTSRPPVIRSTVAAVRASNAGWWNSLLSTSGPTRSRSVAQRRDHERHERIDPAASRRPGHHADVVVRVQLVVAERLDATGVRRYDGVSAAGSSRRRRLCTARSEPWPSVGPHQNSVGCSGRNTRGHARPRHVVVHEHPRAAVDRRRTVALQRRLVDRARVPLVRVERPVRIALGRAPASRDRARPWRGCSPRRRSDSVGRP